MDLYASPPPAPGLESRALWALEPGMDFLNHGSFGATPRVVLAEQARLRARMEAQPVRWFVREEPALVRAAAAALAPHLGCAAERLVFVEHATAGMNAALQSAPLRPGDTVVCLSHVYGAVARTLERLCALRGATLRVAPLPCPVESADAVLWALDAALEGASLAVLDHITSASGLVLPIGPMVARCHARGVPVVVDGAHGPWHVPLHLDTLGAEVYVGNLHKWMCAPKGCAVLVPAPDAPFPVHPTVWSHGTGKGLCAEFDFTGTADRTAWACVPELLRFWGWYGVERARAYTHSLALQARAVLIQALNQPASGPEELVGNLVAVRLPPRFGPAELEQAQRLHDWLWDHHRVEVPVVPLHGALWVRVSAQVYNTLDQVERLAALLARQ